ncbi:MAG: DNA recombination protein RmuC, partial [Kiritimatiellae bacterium]|nr:DNA recombination protein RmuC [Kiritimatiellia bacterium]
FMEHMGTLGEKLNDAVEAFNEAVGSAERRLMPTARRFQELGAGSKELNAVEPLECRARLPEKSGEKE